MRRLGLLSLVPLLLATALSAQTTMHPSWRIESCNGNHGSTRTFSLFGSSVSDCQLRRIVLQPQGELKLNNTNGGIEVFGQERDNIAVEARVFVKARSHAQAEAVEHQIIIHTNGAIHATGPRSSFFRPTWYIDYRLYVPQKIAAHLKSENGGIHLDHLQGTVRAETTNGGLILDALSGDVHAETTNGGISIQLQGDTWQGAGLSADTTNGGIHVNAPAAYSSHLVLDTTNGAISIHFPTGAQHVQHDHFNGNLGHGGPTIKLSTTNGGISVGTN
jgi:DUF4097 and DUF4098 domain-containing protein YvlB